MSSNITECPNCGGKGIELVSISSSDKNDSNTAKCAKCKGSGKIINITFGKIKPGAETVTMEGGEAFDFIQNQIEALEREIKATGISSQNSSSHNSYLLIGLVYFVLGCGLTWLTYLLAWNSGTYILFSGAILVGLVYMIVGIIKRFF